MFADLLFNLFNFLISIIKDMGYLGIFIGMTIESTIFPIPSELILIPAGALIAQSKMSFPLVLSVAIAGTIFGALINFFFAMFFGRRLVNMLVNKYGKFLFITKKNLAKTDNYFKNHGEITTFAGRLIPVVRHLISLPAGFSRMNTLKFIIYTALGGAISVAFLTYLGYFFWDRTEWLNGNLNMLYAPFVIFFLIICVIYLLIKKNKSKRKR